MLRPASPFLIRLTLIILWHGFAGTALSSMLTSHFSSSPSKPFVAGSHS